MCWCTLISGNEKLVSDGDQSREGEKDSDKETLSFTLMDCEDCERASWTPCHRPDTGIFFWGGGEDGGKRKMDRLQKVEKARTLDTV